MKTHQVLSYYGSKYGIAKSYDAPKHRTIIEPFAGGAGYSLHYPEYDVRLYDLNEQVCAVWDYVINVKPDEIRSLPLIKFGEHLNDYNLRQEQRLLVGWWIQYAVPSPGYRLTPLGAEKVRKKSASIWSETRREMVARTSERIKHWKIEQRSYHTIDNEEATWFVDPPYQCKAGRKYKHNEIDFDYLATWCRSRRGQVQVCENTDSEKWLPFVPHKDNAGLTKKTTEVIWRNYEDVSRPCPLF